MVTRRLGTSDVIVSRIGLGTAAFGGIFGARDPEAAKRAIRHALDSGITVIDTAPSYGNGRAETIVGAALRGRRDEVVVSTKVGCYAEDDFDFTERRIRDGLAASLKRLRTDYVDVLLAHDIEFGHPDQIVNETLPLLTRLKAEGTARSIGVSGYPLRPLRTALEATSLDAVLSYCRYDLHDQSLAAELLPWCGETGVIAGSPLAMGLLSSQGPPAWHPADGGLLDAARRASDLCESRGHDLSFVAMQFTLAHPHLDCVLTGASSVEHIDMSIGALNAPLDPDLLGDLRQIFAEVQRPQWPSGNGDWPADSSP
jgi:L-galactose dehydrogenase